LNRFGRNFAFDLQALMITYKLRIFDEYTLQ